MLRDVVAAQPTGEHRLYLTFDDGASGEIDVAEIVEFVGLFAELRDPQKFSQVRVDSDLGTVCWPNGADLDPQVLYSRVTGQPIHFSKPVLT